MAAIAASEPSPGFVNVYHVRMEGPPPEVPTTPIRYSKWIHFCRMLQPGGHLYYLRWRKDKQPTCSNPRCRRKLYSLLRLLHEGRMTREELQFELEAMEFDFVDPVPKEERKRQLAALKARLGYCEMRAVGCRVVAVNWRAGRILNGRAGGEAPLACGNEACWRKAAALVAKARKGR